MAAELLEAQVTALHNIGSRFTTVRAGDEGKVLDQNVIVFEGAQGVLLDEWKGFHPYTTWSTTTSKNARTVLDEARWDGVAEFIGVLRAFATRHGAGPLPTEKKDLHLEYGGETEHNCQNDWQQSFRYGHFDPVLGRYALGIERCDYLALTCLDRVRDPRAWMYATSYGYGDGVKDLPLPLAQDLESQTALTKSLPTMDTTEGGMHALTLRSTARINGAEAKREDIIAAIEYELRCDIKIVSTGPTAKDKARWRK
jgi:adenylosuccinate synthase